MENNISSGLFNLNVRDFLRGIVVAVFSGAVLAIVGIVNTAGFDVFSADWRLIGVLATNGGFSGFVGYIVNRFLTDDKGTLHLGALKIKR